MKFKIGFTAQIDEEDKIESAPVITTPRKQEAVKSLVQIRFPSRNMTLAYFNDRFDLRRRDLVYLHTSMGSFFTEEGAEKQFTLAQGLEWTGGDTFDDYC